jgi:hypothetical protein
VFTFLIQMNVSDTVVGKNMWYRGILQFLLLSLFCFFADSHYG